MSAAVIRLQRGVIGVLLATTIATTAAIVFPAAASAVPASASQASVAAAPNEVVIGFDASTSASERARIERSAGVVTATTVAHLTRLARVENSGGRRAALRALRASRGVTFAAPNVIAHAASFIPNDTGSLGGGIPGGWQSVQWNFLAADGVDAPDAWANVAAAGHPGGSGVTIAVLDTGVAYENRGRFRRSPDFTASQFVRGYDFVAHSPFTDDHNGHGTHVAGTIGEATNNRFGLTGLAWGAKLMPVRVLDSQGEGTAVVISQGVRYAADHGARVINLSLEFSSLTRASEIPELISAIRYAHRRGAVVVGASGNEADSAIAYPARAPDVVSVGATTADGCLADYSNSGATLTLVAPGGGNDAPLSDLHCNPNVAGPPIEQVTFTGSNPARFGISREYIGTSMAVSHVSAIAALVIASGVLGRNPSPNAVEQRLKATARHLGSPGHNALYGAGLVDAATATARTPVTPPAVAAPAAAH
ncbi:MAG: S8 family serine peptidase [Solirubrobacteraceae bacterium]|nr:MAG: hypothetical protein DLM63_08245 [Solirubrobacterales bacterium]